MCTKGLDSDLSYTTADTGAGLFSNWICIAWEQVYVCSAIKLQLSFIPFQNAFIKLKKKKKNIIFSDPKRELSDNPLSVILLYRWESWK